MKKRINNKSKISDRRSEKQNIFSDPETEHIKGSLRKFNSFEEMNEADAESAANMNSLDHIKNTTEILKKIYTEELKNPFDKKIKFR